MGVWANGRRRQRRYEQANETEAKRRATGARYSHLLGRANEAVFLSDDDGRFLEVNDRALEMYGYRREELLGLRLCDLVPLEGRATQGARVLEVLETGMPIAETVHIKANGTHFPVELITRRVDIDGKVLVQYIVRDITERVKAETALQKKLEDLSRLATAVSDSNDAVILHDLEGNILAWNHGAIETYGYSKAEALGMNVRDIVTDTYRETAPALIEAIGHGEIVKPFELRRVTKDGRILDVWLTTTLLTDDQGNPVAVATIERDITERKQVEASLRLTRFSVDHADDGLLWVDREGRFFDVNDFLCSRLGYSREELLGMKVFDVTVGLRPEAWPARWLELKARGSLTFEKQYQTKSGETFPAEITSTVLDHEGHEYLFGFIRDITGRKEAEEALKEGEAQLRQAQKMEAIGRLAGGIAHDFNNLLTAILGYSDLILASEECAAGSLRGDVEEIKAAGERGSALTRQILAFSRREAPQPEVLSLNEILIDSERFLVRTLGEDIDLVTLPHPELGLTGVDRRQFEQVLLNLALNARDAMPGGGRLTLETANVELDDDYCRVHGGTEPGAYVMLAVSDTGTGMNEETKSHVFEPFFTTKEPGKGTGLGLATLYVTVKQSGGSVLVYSELGQGTTFKVYLPRVNEPTKALAAAAEMPASLIGCETILVVEDEVALRVLIKRVLEHHGYTILLTGSSDEALRILDGASPPVDLLLTDVVLAGNLQGDELVRAARVLHPDLPALYMSGYTRNAAHALRSAGRRGELP